VPLDARRKELCREADREFVVAADAVRRVKRPVHHIAPRRVDDLVQAMGLSGISKSQVSKLCKDIDERVRAFLDRPLAGEWPYLWLDATYLKQREGGRIVPVER
jgi:transposase-like protein